MKKGSAAFYVVLALALLGVLAAIAYGFSNTFTAGWKMISGTADEKANLKTLDDTITAVLDPTKTTGQVNIAVTAK